MASFFSNNPSGLRTNRRIQSKKIVAPPMDSSKDIGVSELKRAVKNRNLTVIKQILSKNINITNVELDDNLLLHEPFYHVKGDLELEKSVVNILKTFLVFGANVNCVNDDGHTALHLALANRMTEAINFLISHNAKFNVDKAGDSIIHFLIKQEFQKCKQFHNFKQDRVPLVSLSEKFQTESTEFIEFMLSKGLQYVDDKNNEGDTPLHLAAKYNLIYALEILLKHTKNVKIVNNSGETPFQVFFEATAQTLISWEYQTPKYVEQICEKFQEKESSLTITGDRINSLLHSALKHRMQSLAKLMLKYIKMVDARDEEGNTALNIVMDCHLCDERIEEIVNILLAKEADIHVLNNNDISPLITAVRRRRLSILKLFVEHKADFGQNRSKKNLLQHYLETKSPMNEKMNAAVFNLLVNQGHNVKPENSDVLTPFHMAVKSGTSEVVDNLIKQGVNINARDKSHGYSALHEAVIGKHYDVAKLLIKAEVNVNAKDNDGMTPLHFVAMNGSLEICRMLLGNGAKVDSRESTRAYTPLHLAILHVKIESAKLLIRSGADVNAKTRKGQSPFHLLSNNSVELARHLLGAGACIDFKDNDGFLPLQVAISCRYDKVVHELLRFGADINDNARALRETDRQSTSKCIREYLMKIKTAGGYVDRELAIYVGSNFTQADILFRQSCLKEIEKLKSYIIINDVSVYDFLQINRNSACHYVKKRKLKGLVMSQLLEKEFPLYYEIILCTYNQAMQRRLLLEPARQTWNKLRIRQLPKSCIYQIFANLSNMDLRIMTLGE